MVTKATLTGQAHLKPFLKWAGGKTQLLPVIQSIFPDFILKGEPFTYVEPFVGSGAVLFHVLENFRNLKKVVINDANKDLMNAYSVIRDEPEALIAELQKLQEKFISLAEQEDRKSMFYQIREQFNGRKNKVIVQTAQFIFLNRTCYNGLFRVNSQNKFNVPFGRYKNPRICDSETIRAASIALQKVILLNSDFEQTAVHIDQRSFVYFDPPYKPLSASASFNTYQSIPFDDSEQIRLKQFCDRLTEQKVPWLLSNSDSTNRFFDELYQNYLIERVKARRAINSKGHDRGPIFELLIRNYPG